MSTLTNLPHDIKINIPLHLIIDENNLYKATASCIYDDTEINGISYGYDQKEVLSEVYDTLIYNCRKHDIIKEINEEQYDNKSFGIGTSEIYDHSFQNSLQ